MNKFKLYHFCPVPHAKNILKRGFKPSRNEKIIAALDSNAIGGQHNTDLVSFTSTYTDPFRIAVAVVHAMRTRMKGMSLEIAVIEVEVSREDLVRVFPSMAILFVAGGQQVMFGQGLEVTVDRAHVNKLIKQGKAKLVHESKMKRDKRLVEMAKQTMKSISGKELKQAHALRKQAKKNIASSKMLLKKGLISKKEVSPKIK